jgi:hypothetical protein
MNRKWTRIAALAGALAPSFASATLLIDDGGTHVFGSTIGQSVTLDNGSTLRLTSGGSITGDGTSAAQAIPPFARGALEAGAGSNSNIFLEGNSVVSAGIDRVGISRFISGELHVGGNSVVQGGAVGNTALFGYGVTSPPGPQLLKTFLTDHAVINGHVESDGYISISGNALINGNLLEANSGMALEMDGGLITGHVRNASLVDHTVLIRGGSILGGYSSTASSLDFAMNGGTLEGGWSARSRIMDVEIKGGEIAGGMNFGWIGDPFSNASSVNIFGGSIDASLGGWLFDFTPGFDATGYTSLDCSSNNTSFNLWGGQLGSNSAGNGIRMNLCANLDVYGTNLNYSSGWLTGLLADGSLLNVAVTEGDLWSGQVRLHDTSVPEPGTLGLLGMALGAMAMTRRRRIAARA